MVLPALTPEQRTAALEASVRARRCRAEVKDRLRHGRGRLREVLGSAATDDAVARMRVSALLQALPGVGPVAAGAAMAEVGVPERRRVGGLGPHQVCALLDRFEP